MGIYVFKKSVLLDLLTNKFKHANDFSRDILSVVCGQVRVRGGGCCCWRSGDGVRQAGGPRLAGTWV